uniref:Major vault protein n=1 Tax=Globisporangium ultimum (strain ATCC 200006 / CBS 805.95 / DAOM BR144) TaxID=431595 RepID=K3X224_GLOUD
MLSESNAISDANGNGPRVIRLPPYKYVHMLDTNSNVARVLEGPLTYTRQEHEHVLTHIQDMIVLPAQHYIEIRNPVVRTSDGDIARDKFNQAKLRHGEFEIRIHDEYPEPFPLYPGEVQVDGIKKLRVLPVDTALRLRVTRKVDKYVAGDEWLFVGPATYYPRVEEDVIAVVHAIIIRKNQAIKFRAEKKCKDSQGIERDAGEEWLVRTPGAYLPQIDEVLVETMQAHILTDKTALHLRALRTFKDVYGVQRKAGEEWLVTSNIAETHVQDVHEAIVGSVDVITLTNRQYCVIVDPVVDGVQKRGTRQLRKGETSFFLLPGEALENGKIQDVCILADDEAVLVQAIEAFTEKVTTSSTTSTTNDMASNNNNSNAAKVADIKREAGERWMVHGPREYIPPIEVQVLEVRKAIPLDTNEGVYVRDKKTGHVRAVKGQTYMLQPTEELWSKYLSPEVEALLFSQSAGSAYVADPTVSKSSTWASSLGGQHAALRRSSASTRTRDPTRVVTFEVPHNAAIQVYDYKTTSSRIMFGPTLVMLDPEEQFTELRLAGGVPKEPNVIRTLCLQLGPDFMRDKIIVETSDHARLSLTIAYNWHFKVDPKDPEDAAKVFNVKDFVGDACKTLASRIRGAVAVESFDHFHKHSAQIIRTSIFGVDDKGKLRDSLLFDANNLCITNVDIQSAEPVDQLTRESLQKSVQLAIEITTKSQEARAKSQAQQEDEEAKGLLLKQQLENQSQAEEARKNLVQLTAECSAMEAQGAAVGKAKADAQAAEIEGLAAVRQAELRAQASRIEHEAKLVQLREEQELSIAHAKQLADIEISKKRELMSIESEKFQQMVGSIGKETLVEMARVGPESQVKMLEALGLNGYLITDGKSPVNLMGTAEGLIRGISNAPA